MEKWQPLVKDRLAKNNTWNQEALDAAAGKNPEVWCNNLYTVLVRRGLGSDEALKHTWLSIKRNDKEPVRDWRHFQWIKNQLVGPEHEAIEIYPKESRLVDQANQYHLWVLENPDFSFPFGFKVRVISEHPTEGSRQRAWPKNMKPHDLAEQERAQRDMLKPFMLISQDTENVLPETQGQ